VIDSVDVVLASASPRRQELLARLGLRLRVEPTAIDETPRADERPLDYVRRMAAEK
jgi:septum formation protein